MSKKSKQHISEYANYKMLFEMKKPRSPITIRYCTNDLPDEHLIDYIEYRSKSGEITYNCFVIKPDINNHTKMNERDGFKKIINT